VYAIVVPFQAEGDLRLTLSAEENNFVEIVVRTLLRSIVLKQRAE